MFSFFLPFFSEAGRKSNRVLPNSKLLMKTFSFYSAAEADGLYVQWLPLDRDACHVDGAYHYAGVLFFLSNYFKRTFLFRLGSANVAISPEPANDG